MRRFTEKDFPEIALAAFFVQASRNPGASTIELAQQGAEIAEQIIREDNPMAKTHNLKCWPKYFEAVMSGAKTFELRLDDRGFEVGDKIQLQEWDPNLKAYTGGEVELSITYVMRLREYLDVKGMGWQLARRLMPNLVILGFLSPFGWGYDDGFDEDSNELDYWLSECGQQQDGSCLQAGTEECDFECPFRRRIEP